MFTNNRGAAMSTERWDEVAARFALIVESDFSERERLLGETPDELRGPVLELLSNHDAAESKNLLGSSLFDTSDLFRWMGREGVFQPGETLQNGFEVVRLIGRGGMGEVYETRDPASGELYAVKTIRPDLIGEPEAIPRFRREVEKARRVTHPNVCRVHHIVEPAQNNPNGVPFFVMDLLLGDTLEDLIRTDGIGSLDLCREIAIQICAGLQAVHSAGIVHRDLKAGNIMLTRGSDEQPRAVLTDFGIARDAIPSSEISTLTSAGQLAGTVAYLAPELLEGNRATTSSDLYALGVLLFRLVTGRYPFEADAELISAAVRMRQPAPLPSVYRKDLDGAWNRTISACLERDPARRPSTAAMAAGLLSGATGDRLALGKVRTVHALNRRSVAASLGVAVAGCGAALVWRLATQPPFRDRPFRVLVEDFTSPDAGGAFGRAFRNVVRLRMAAAPGVLVVRPAEVLRALESLNFATQPLRGEAARKIAERTRADVRLNGTLSESSKGYTARVEAVSTTTGRILAAGRRESPYWRSLVEMSEVMCGELYRALTGRAASEVGSATQSHDPDTSRPDAFERFTSAIEYQSYGEIETALGYLKDATSLDPQFSLAFVYQAIVLGALRRDVEAFGAASRAYELRERLNERQRLQAETIYYHFCGDLDRALETEKKLVAEFPQEASLHRGLAQTFSALNLTDDAIQHCQTAVSLDPKAPVSYMVLASTEAQSGAFDAALRTLERGRAIVPGAAVLDSSEGVVRMLKGDRTGALAALSRLEKKPNYGDHARLHMIRCHLLFGDLPAASRALATEVDAGLTSTNPTHEELTLYWMGALDSLENRRQPAVSRAEILADRVAEPYNLSALRSAAVLALQTGQAAMAGTVLAKMKSIEARYPSNGTSSFRLLAGGIKTALDGDLRGARTLLQRTCGLRPDIVNSWILAEICEQDDLFREALTLYEGIVVRKGVAVRWDQPLFWAQSLFRAARCHAKLGRRAEARQYYRRFVEQWSEGSDVDLVRQAVAEIKSV